MSDSSLLSFPYEYQYFIKKFEFDVQLIFNQICLSKDMPFVKVDQLIRKGNFYLKADYFIPIKSFETFQLNCEELLKKLSEITYLNEVEVDSNFNLTFCLNRPDVYQIVLNEVIKYDKSYGMTAKPDSVLVLICNDDSNDFNNKRNNILAEHIISILCANKVKVYYQSSCSILKFEDTYASELTCSDNCCFDSLCQQISESLSISEFKKESEISSHLWVDAKRYLEQNSLLEKYGKDINNIVIQDEDNNQILHKVSSIKHLLDKHLPGKPDFIIYVASHGINRLIWKVGILLQIVEKKPIAQTYIFNQSIKIADNSETSVADYLQSYKKSIEKAMFEKYSVDICHDKVWSLRIENLVNSAVKFDFLKLNPNMALKLVFSNSHNTEKNAGIFVQYNFARLSNLFRNFEMKVDEGYYEPLKPLQDIDFSLLRLEEEWNLFQYVVSFPKLVERILNSLTSESTLKTRYPMNGICLMLSDLCHYLSLYYSKIRILAGPQKHLQKLMNARLWLLKGIYQVLLNSFILLGIQGLDQM